MTSLSPAGVGEEIGECSVQVASLLGAIDAVVLVRVHLEQLQHMDSIKSVIVRKVIFQSTYQLRELDFLSHERSHQLRHVHKVNIV